MKRLVDKRYLADEQYDEVLSLLRQAGIPVHETPTHLFSFGALWVPDEAHGRAREILSGQASAFAARARAQWQREWEIEHRGSGLRWFAHRLFHNPAGTLLRVLLLTLAVGAFVLYPIWYALR